MLSTNIFIKSPQIKLLGLASIAILSFGLFFSSASKQVYANTPVPGLCYSIPADQRPSSNSFSCSADISGNWQVDDVGPCIMGSGFEPDYGLCSGSLQTNNICGGASECCIPCRTTISEDDQENRIAWGGACDDSTKHLCIEGTSCRHSMCLRAPGSTLYGTACRDNSECNQNENPDFGTIYCRERSFGGELQCLHIQGFFCNSNEECQTRLNDPNASCNASGVCIGNAGEVGETIFPFKICDQISNPEQLGQCNSCLNADGLWTAVGCINREPTNIVRTFVRIGLGLAGGTALLIILASAFMLSTSQGDPKKVGDAKEMLTAAIIGILFVVFSIVVLQFIGVTILQIPGFGDS